MSLIFSSCVSFLPCWPVLSFSSKKPFIFSVYGLGVSFPRPLLVSSLLTPGPSYSDPFIRCGEGRSVSPSYPRLSLLESVWCMRERPYAPVLQEISVATRIRLLDEGKDKVRGASSPQASLRWFRICPIQTGAKLYVTKSGGPSAAH